MTDVLLVRYQYFVAFCFSFRSQPFTYSECAHLEWRRLVVHYRVSGVQVHDARIVAAMQTHGITHLLTFNGDDFRRFSEITVVHPSEITL